MFRVGIGQDSHKIKSKKQKAKSKNDKPLILAGVLVDRRVEVESDSDGDVIIHSLCNALNTAVGLGSFGVYARAMYKKGIRDSKEYLKVGLEKVQEKGLKINNVAMTIEAKQPKLEKHREKITVSLARLLRISKENIGISFSSGDSLTSFGKGKGIQAFCLVTLVK